MSTQFAYNGDGVRAGKTTGAATTDYLVDLASRLPVVISDTDAVYLYGLDIIAEQLAGADRYYYVHDGLGSVRQLLETTGQIATRYAYDPFGVPVAGNAVPNPWQFTGEARKMVGQVANLSYAAIPAVWGCLLLCGGTDGFRVLLAPWPSVLPGQSICPVTRRL